MNSLESNSEILDLKAKALQHFFETLPDNMGSVCNVEREKIDSLLENGVSVEDVCLGFVQKGFLLHGTDRANLDTLEPRQANDEDGYEENLKNGVYATRDPRIPLFMSIVKGIPGRAHYSITGDNYADQGFTESVIFSTTFDIPTDKIGYIYVISPENFEEQINGGQLVSSSPVAPTFVVPVTISDFTYHIDKVKE